MKDLLNSLNLPMTIFTYNQSVIALARNPIYHTKAKHIDISFYKRTSKSRYNVIGINNHSVKYVST